jgi:beta-glucosidase
MNISHREAIAGAALGLSAAQIDARARTRRALPKDFLWGTAISAYQSEGNNTNTDAWLQENLTKI